MEHSNEFPVEKMCRVLGVSRSGYYLWKNRDGELGPLVHDLDEAIKLAFDKSLQTYGSPRVATMLQRDKPKVSSATVARRMRALKLRARRPKCYVRTTDSSHSESLSANLLERDFTATDVACKYVSDITYIAVGRSWAYLTVIIDLADRAVVSWVLSDTMRAEDTTVAAFNLTLDNRRPRQGAIFHSDRGVQYACSQLRDQLRNFGVIQSMSRKGNCWDNAVAESFFKTLKTECIYRHHFDTMEQARKALFRYIDGFYNTVRIHTSLGGISPAEAYEQIINLPAATNA